MPRLRCRALLLVVAIASAVGCASKQRIALDCVPSGITVYVDGRALEGSPDSVSLRVDQPHTVYFKGEGYRPQMVVLKSWEEDGRKRLTPADLCAEVAFVATRPEVHMEIEPKLSEEKP